MTTKKTTLSCGGKGPCCHIAYAHRHCEHCDMVISLVSQSYPAPYYRPWMWWTNGTDNTFNQLNGAMGAGNQSIRAFNASASPERAPLPEHTCP